MCRVGKKTRNSILSETRAVYMEEIEQQKLTLTLKFVFGFFVIRSFRDIAYTAVRESANV